jgi:hypothetical protein
VSPHASATSRIESPQKPRSAIRWVANSTICRRRSAAGRRTRAGRFQGTGWFILARATRVDGRQALIEWDAVAGAQGYNVRYGLAPQKLYHSWLVYEQTDLDLPALNAGADYWAAVDSFNENGVTPGRPVPIVGRPR